MDSRPDILKKMHEFNRVIENQVLMCDNSNDVLAFACLMLQSIKEIFDKELGIEGRKQMFKDLV